MWHTSGAAIAARRQLAGGLESLPVPLTGWVRVQEGC